MGLIGKALGLSGAVSEIGAAVGDVAEVFVPNATKNMVLGHQAFGAVMAQYGAEFQSPRDGMFDRFVNGLNRLPRPALAIGTLGLFVHAMVSPEHFSQRMQGLALVPEPLWWLLGAVVSFYFGAREMYHVREGRKPVAIAVQAIASVEENAALTEWNNSQR
ncbi:MAG: hypothetical protein ACI8YI_000288 [Paracoccaceae bacterium]|jgi:hypothetical protein